MAINRTEYSPNYTVVGSPTITDDFVVSNFSTSNYLISEGESVLTAADVTSFEIVIDITTGSSHGTYSRIIQPLSALNTNRDAANSPFITIENSIIKFVFYNGSNYYSCSTGLNTVATNTRYLFKWTYSNTRGVEGYYSTDGGDTWEGNTLLNWRTIQWAEKEFVLGTRGSGLDTTFRGSIHLENCYIKVNDEMWWQPLLEEQVDVSGSVEISKGYTSDGSNSINMPSSTYNIDALTANQTIGGKNKLFAYTDSTDSVGALITSTTPTGSFKITKDLEHPVYLDPTKNYIAGGELREPSLSFMSGALEPWVQPILTSATSYGTCTDSRNNTGESQEGWRALDGIASSDFSPALSGGWWKWVVPDMLTFKAGVSAIIITSSDTASAMDIQFFADEDATKPLTEVVTLPSTAGANTPIPVINTEITNTIYMTIAAHSNWSEISEISFVNVFKGAVEASVSSTKALQYSEYQDTTYWIPSEATVSLDSVKAVQSVGPVNDLYLTTTAGTPTASLSFSDNGEIGGVHNKLPLKQKVYLNNETDKILGVQERPNEIIIKGGTQTNYATTGSPTITSDYVVSGLSSSNYLSRSTSTTFSPDSFAWEIKAKVTTGSSLGSEEIFIDPNYDQRGIRIGFQEHSGPKWQFLVSRGTSWINTSDYYGSYTVQPNTTYWIKAGYTGSEYYLEYSTDGSEYTRDVTYSSSYTVGSYALRIRSYSSYSWSGSVDLKETSVTIGSELWWKPVSILNGIAVSGWSVLYSDVTDFTGDTALDYTTPVVIDASSLDIPTDSGTNYGRFLYYTNGDMKCIVTSRKVLDKAVFTGHYLSIRDGVIQSVRKRGELCAAFVQRGYDRSTRRYLFIPAANLRDGPFTTRAGEGFYDMSVQGTLPPCEVGASMKNIVYLRNSKTVVFEGNIFDYIGNMMCILVG